MRIWILSDLHIDVAHYELAGTPEGTDVLVVAGDVCGKLSKKVLPWLAEHVVPRRVPTIYVPGNHDFYGTNLSTELAKARPLAAALGIHLLAEGEVVTIGGVRFVGGTLWTDYQVYGDAAASKQEALAWMNDHRKIRWGADYRKFRVNEAVAEHLKCRDRLQSALKEPWDGPTVVVSHHAPDARSLRHETAVEPLEGSYASDLAWLIERGRPELWVHGHIHVSRDYRVHGTRIVCNPRGYVVRTRRGGSERVEVENPDHDPCLTVDT